MQILVAMASCPNLIDEMVAFLGSEEVLVDEGAGALLRQRENFAVPPDPVEECRGCVLHDEAGSMTQGRSDRSTTRTSRFFINLKGRKKERIP